MHDEVTTDKQNPTVNANGPVYAVSAGHGQLVVLDPIRNTDRGTRDPDARAARTKVPSRFPAPNRPSLWWGDQWLWSNPPYDPADPHNPMMDSKGRVWMTSKIRSNQDPAWCNDRATSTPDWFPLRSSGRQASFYDPKTKQFTLIDTCYSTHHLQFDNDPTRRCTSTSLSGPIFGWIDTKVYDADPGRTEGSRLVRSGRSIPTATARSRGPGMSWADAARDSVLYATDTATAAASPNAGRRRQRRSAKARRCPAPIPSSTR